MELQVGSIGSEEFENMKRRLYDSASGYSSREVLLEVGSHYYYLGIEIETGKSTRKLVAIPWAIDPTSDDYFRGVCKLPIIKLPRVSILTSEYGIDDEGNPVPLRPDEEVYVDSVKGQNV